MINNFVEKLNGELPVTREELFTLVDSWGRKDYFETDDRFMISKCEPKECYPLDNLDA